MTKAQQIQYREAVKHFNRVGGQLKRNHNIDPIEYLNSESSTVKGVERALNKMRFDAEQEDITRRIEEYERAFEEMLEAKEMEQSTRDIIDQYDKAQKTLNERYDLDWNETDSQLFWDAFDDSDIIDAFGSTQVIDMGNNALKNDQITVRQAAEIAKRLAGQMLGSGLTNNEKRDRFDDLVNEYIALRESRTHDESISELFK